MKSPFGIRLYSLIAALLFVGSFTIYEIYTAFQRVEQLQNKLTHYQLESFQLASEIHRELLALNNSMLGYTLVRNSDQWTQFEKASSDLDHWIDAHDPSLNPHSLLATDSEKRLFKELNAAYDDYLSSARAVHSNGKPALVTRAQLAELDAFNGQARRMRELVVALSEAHQTAQAGFLVNATESLASLQHILIANVVAMLILVGALAWLIYRDMIAPLRTKLIRSQVLLEKQEKLVTLGTLAAGIAHEIRNPLTSLKARLYTLEKQLQSLPSARKHTDIIGAEISRLERIVQEILNFAHPSDPKFESIAADSLLREIQGLMAPDLESRRLHLVLEPGDGLQISADSAHLKQVLINLVRNASEAVETGGTVTLRARGSRMSLGGRVIEVVILEVADDGAGISPEVEKRLFDPFFSTKETGTGLGLSIAARIVEKQGGMLQYQTRPGHGTTFGVVLPREIVTQAKTEPGLSR